MEITQLLQFDSDRLERYFTTLVSRIERIEHKVDTSSSLSDICNRLEVVELALGKSRGHPRRRSTAAESNERSTVDEANVADESVETKASQSEVKEKQNEQIEGISTGDGVQDSEMGRDDDEEPLSDVDLRLNEICADYNYQITGVEAELDRIQRRVSNLSETISVLPSTSVLKTYETTMQSKLTEFENAIGLENRRLKAEITAENAKGIRSLRDWQKKVQASTNLRLVTMLGRLDRQEKATNDMEMREKAATRRFQENIDRLWAMSKVQQELISDAHSKEDAQGMVEDMVQQLKELRVEYSTKDKEKVDKISAIDQKLKQSEEEHTKTQALIEKLVLKFSSETGKCNSRIDLIGEWQQGVENATQEQIDATISPLFQDVRRSVDEHSRRIANLVQESKSSSENLLQDILQTKQSIRENIEKLSQIEKRLEDTTERLESDVSQTELKIKEEMNNELRRMSTAIKSVSEHSALVKEHARDHVEKLQEDFAAHVSEAKSSFATSTQLVQTLQQQANDLQQRLTEASQDLDTFKNSVQPKVEDNMCRIAFIETENQTHNKEIKLVSQRQGEARSLIALCRSNIDRLQNEISDLERNYSSFKDTYKLDSDKIGKEMEHLAKLDLEDGIRSSMKRRVHDLAQVYAAYERKRRETGGTLTPDFQKGIVNLSYSLARSISLLINMHNLRICLSGSEDKLGGSMASPLAFQEETELYRERTICGVVDMFSKAIEKDLKADRAEAGAHADGKKMARNKYSQQMRTTFISKLKLSIDSALASSSFIVPPVSGAASRRPLLPSCVACDRPLTANSAHHHTHNIPRTAHTQRPVDPARAEAGIDADSTSNNTTGTGNQTETLVSTTASSETLHQTPGKALATKPSKVLPGLLPPARPRTQQQGKRPLRSDREEWYLATARLSGEKEVRPESMQETFLQGVPLISSAVEDHRPKTDKE